MENERNYYQQFSYYEQYKLAKEKRAYYLRDEAEFAAYNNVRFTPDWADKWAAKITACEEFISDEDIVDQSTSLSDEIEALMAKARKHYQRYIKPFVEDAFPNNKRLQNQFGFDDYNEARQTASRMVMFLKKVHLIAKQHEASLLSVGMKLQHIDELSNMHDLLSPLAIKQSTFVGVRITSGQERRKIFDEMNEMTWQTCRTGKIIYLDENPAKYRCYLLPNRSNSSGEPNYHYLDAGAKIIALNEVSETDFVEIENADTAAFVAYIGTNTHDAVPQTTFTIDPQTRTTFSVIDLGFNFNTSEKQHLIFWNGGNERIKYGLDKME